MPDRVRLATRRGGHASPTAVSVRSDEPLNVPNVLLSPVLTKENQFGGRAGVSPAMGAGRRGDRPYDLVAVFFNFTRADSARPGTNSLPHLILSAANDFL